MSDHHRFHLGDLQLALGLPEEASRTADAILERDPGSRSLLALVLRARSRVALGDQEGAARDYRRIVETNRIEVERQREDYDGHHALPFPDVVGEAQAYLPGSG